MLSCISVIYQVSVYQTMSQSKTNYFRFLQNDRKKSERRKTFIGEWKVEKNTPAFEKEVIGYFFQEHDKSV